MPGFVIDGVQEQVEGLSCLSWLDNPRFHLSREDFGRRATRWVRAIVLHTTSGKVGQVLPGLGPDRHVDEKVLSYWSTSPSSGGAHIVVDSDGSMLCCADLQAEAAWHATSVNQHTIGIEIGQTYVGSVATVYEEQLRVVRVLVDWLTRRFRIQRQVQSPYHSSDHPVPRLVQGGVDVVGVYGHRDQTHDRGEGDPGNSIIEMLLEVGYKGFDFALDSDRTYWKAIQEMLNRTYHAALHVDGIPGPGTARALEAAGYPHGLMLTRPGD